MSQLNTSAGLSVIKALWSSFVRSANWLSCLLTWVLKWPVQPNTGVIPTPLCPIVIGGQSRLSPDLSWANWVKRVYSYLAVLYPLTPLLDTSPLSFVFCGNMNTVAKRPVNKVTFFEPIIAIFNGHGCLTMLLIIRCTQALKMHWSRIFMFPLCVYNVEILKRLWFGNVNFPPGGV